MKPFHHFLFFGLSFLLLFTSCDQALVKNKDLALKSIPETASTVTAFRVPQLLAKADFQNFKELPVYQEMIKEANNRNPALGKIAEQPNNSGIDFRQNIYAFTQLANNNPEDIFNGLLIPLEDVDAFEDMLDQMNLEEIQEIAGCKYIKTNRISGIAWNNSLALIGLSSQYNSNLGESMAACLRGDQASIVGDKNLQQTLSDDSDIVVWASSNALANYKDAQLMIAGLGFDPQALQNNYIQGTLNFEKGEVIGHSKLLLRKELSRDLDLLFKDHVSTDFTPYVPGENLGLAFSAALDFKGLNQVLAERPQSKGFLNYALKEYGLTIDDLAKALNGDLLLAIYNQADTKTPNLLFATAIDDQKIFDQFLQLAVDQNLIEKKETGFYDLKDNGLTLSTIDPDGMPLKDQKAYLLLAHDMAFVSSNIALLENIKTGDIKKSARLPKDLSNQISSNIFSAMLNFDHLGDLQPQMEYFPLQHLSIKAARKTSDFRLQMKDQENNSLKTLLWMMNEVYEKDQMELGEEKKVI